MSDNVPSAVEGDLGGGDTLSDRTIFISMNQVIARFPTSQGTHEFSFPPAQFMVIHLSPFDTTAEFGGVFASATKPGPCNGI